MMVMSHFPKATEKFEIQAYRRTKDLKELRKQSVPFSGSPQKHPYDPEKIILVSDPYSGNTVYYEFLKEDISHVEDLSNLVNSEGETVQMARIWVLKKRVAVRCTPFMVEDIWSTYTDESP